MNVDQALKQGAALLAQVTTTGDLEAQLLLSHITGLGRTSLLAHPEVEIQPKQLDALVDSIARRAEGYPLPYLTHGNEFYGLRFTLTPDVLIPRPETETLVELALTRRAQTIVDVGTGSGCIAVALAANLPTAHVYATDISHQALQVAAINAHSHRVSGRVHLIQCDLVPPIAGPVDLIVSNPPYISRQEWSSLPYSVRTHEPRIALDGGEEGLGVIERLLYSARLFGNGNGAHELGTGGLLIEIGAGQGEGVTQLARSIFPQARIVIHRDLAGRDRVLELTPSA